VKIEKTTEYLPRLCDLAAKINEIIDAVNHLAASEEQGDPTMTEIAEIAAEVNRKRGALIEEYAGAWLKRTGLDPTTVKLVERRTENGIEITMQPLEDQGSEHRCSCHRVDYAGPLDVPQEIQDQAHRVVTGVEQNAEPQNMETICNQRVNSLHDLQAGDGGKIRKLVEDIDAVLPRRRGGDIPLNTEVKTDVVLTRCKDALVKLQGEVASRRFQVCSILERAHEAENERDALRAQIEAVRE